MPTLTDPVLDGASIEQRRADREREALAASYEAYAASSSSPVTFEQYRLLMAALTETTP